MKALILTITIFCASPFLTIGFCEVYKTNQEIDDFTHTTGTIVGNSYVTYLYDGNTSGAYLPEVEFYAGDGKKIRFTDKIGSLPPDYEPETQIEIIYNPKDPQDARIYSWKRIWFVPILLSGIGLLPIVIGVFLLRWIK